MSYVRDWETTTEISPWINTSGYSPNLNGGMYPNNGEGAIHHINCSYQSGTSIVTFKVAPDYGYDCLSEFGFSVWNTNGRGLFIILKVQQKNFDVNFWLEYNTYDEATGKLHLIGSTIYENSYGFDAEGTIELSYSGGSGWNAVLVYDGAFVCNLYSNTGEFNPTVNENCNLGHTYNFDYGSKDVVKVLHGSYTPNVLSVPIDRTFWYDGYYHNGTELAGNLNPSYNLTDALLTHSPIQQYLYIPSASGVFSSQVVVTMKNNNNQWSDFTGYTTTQESYNPPGIFYLSNVNIGTTETLFAGFLDYETIKIDALNQTISFTLNSVVSVLQDKPIVAPDDICRDGGNTTFPCISLGDITLVTYDSQEDNYIITVSGSLDPINKYTWLTVAEDISSDNESFTAIDISVEDQTITLKKLPNDVTTGAKLYYLKPYTGDGYCTGETLYWDVIRTSLTRLIEFQLDGLGGTSPYWNLDDISSLALSSVALSLSKPIYGHETFLEVLDEMLLAIGGGGCSAYDGEIVNILVPSPTYLLQGSSYSLNYETDCYNALPASKNKPVKSIYIQFAYDEETKRYTHSIRVDTGNSGGDDKTLKTWMLTYEEDARFLGFYSSTFFGSGSTLEAITDLTHWAGLKLGAIIDVSNLPEEYEYEIVDGAIEPTFLVVSKVFNPDTNLVNVILQQVMFDVSAYFRVGIHYIGGEVGVL